MVGQTLQAIQMKLTLLVDETTFEARVNVRNNLSYGLSGLIDNDGTLTRTWFVGSENDRIEFFDLDRQPEVVLIPSYIIELLKDHFRQHYDKDKNQFDIEMR